MNKNKIYLLKADLEFMLKNLDLTEKMLSLLKKKNLYQEIYIDHDTADILRDLCGEKLQEVGFDFNYNPTEKGIILESLIDKLYIDRVETREQNDEE